MNHEEERQVRDDSDTLMRSLTELKNLEARKRDEEISTPRFHEMAEQVEQQARKVFEVASIETVHGDRTGEPTGLSIEDVPPRDERAGEPRVEQREEPADRASL
jgi:hypothetical protein